MSTKVGTQSIITISHAEVRLDPGLRRDDGGVAVAASEMNRALGDGKGGFFHRFGESRMRVASARQIFGRA